MKLNKNNIIYIFIILIFFSLTLFVGCHHEPWADEAQAWLIARDNNFYDIYFHILKYEGAPFLWQFVLHSLTLLHFPYDFLFIIPIFFTTLGLILFLYKSKFPFTFFIFYQYSIIARSYTLMFPICAVIAILYPKRIQRPFWYILFLGLLASISAHSFVLSFMLLCFFTIDIYNENKNKNIKEKLLNYIPSLLLIIYMFINYIILKTPKDCNFPASLDLSNFLSPFVYVQSFFMFNKVWLGIRTQFINQFIGVLLVLLFYIYSIKTFCKNKKQVAFFVCLNYGIIFFISFFYGKMWHLGIIIITYLLSCWILLDENKIDKIVIKENFIFYLLLILVFSRQILFSIQTSILDIKNNFGSSKEIALFLKSNYPNVNNVVGYGYRTVSVQPYFKNNIYENYDESYWLWSVKSLERKKSYKCCVDIMLVDNVERDYYKKEINDVLTDFKIYDVKEFEGHMYAFGHILENTDMTVFIRKNKCR